MRPVALIGTSAPIAERVQRLKERYKFLKAPERFEEFIPQTPQQPLTFQGGRFTVDNREVGILSLQFLLFPPPGLIVADTQSSTDDSDFLLDDYTAYAKTFHPEAVTPIGPAIYLSQLEFALNGPPHLLPQYEEAARAVDHCLADYGLKLPKFGFWGLSLNFDTRSVAGIAPPFFAVERRIGFPFESNVFFSQAPLRTKDHIALLEKIDATFH
jgi:hypothetical protein